MDSQDRSDILGNLQKLAQARMDRQAVDVFSDPQASVKHAEARAAEKEALAAIKEKESPAAKGSLPFEA